MNIGEAAKISGISARMIRYYEQIKLLPLSQRTETGYRSYGQKDIHRLKFIRRAREPGFLISDIGKLLVLWNDRSLKSADVKRLAQANITDLESRIKKCSKWLKH